MASRAARRLHRPRGGILRNCGIRVGASQNFYLPMRLQLAESAKLKALGRDHHIRTACPPPKLHIALRQIDQRLSLALRTPNELDSSQSSCLSLPRGWVPDDGGGPPVPPLQS